VTRNLWSTRRIAVEDAEAFSPGVPAGMNGPCPLLRRRTGSPVGVGGLAVAAFVWRYDAVLRDLEPCASDSTRSSLISNTRLADKSLLLTYKQ
jgi:hypothetical protein